MNFLGVFSVALVYALVAPSKAEAQSNTQWRITQPTWTESTERQFGEFVTGLGEAVEARRCNSVSSCMKSVANPYYNSDPRGLKYYADCADLPYYLRGYFAWKNGLPYSVASAVQANLAPGEDPMAPQDLRYTSLGNSVKSRYDITVKNGTFDRVYPNAINILNEVIPGLTFSATLRIPGIDESGLPSDFYPAKVDRSAIRPGTVIYDPAGHVAIIYKVTEDGRIFYIDAHPDNSLTMGLFTPKFSRSKPGHGAGFKNFRPTNLIGAQQDSSGEFVGGRIRLATNAELPLFGTEGFYGNQPDPAGWNRGKFILNGQAVSYYEYVRMKLTRGEMSINPILDMQQLTDDICTSLLDRIASVDAARTSGIAAKPHPARLPMNIYGTEGEWENYSTPSRDARLKVSFVDLLAQTKSNLERFKRRDPTIKYNGGNLAKDLLRAYSERAQACQFSYTTSNGRTVRMNLEAARLRLFKMSFDPYHCIELRWGATSAEELSSCGDDANKRAWYTQQQWLRNQSERRYDARMDFSLSELTGPLPNVGVATPPDIDIVGYLKSQQ